MIKKIKIRKYNKIKVVLTIIMIFTPIVNSYFCAHLLDEIDKYKEKCEEPYICQEDVEY